MVLSFSMRNAYAVRLSDSQSPIKSKEGTQCFTLLCRKGTQAFFRNHKSHSRLADLQYQLI